MKKTIIFLLVVFIIMINVSAAEIASSTETNKYTTLDNVSAEKMYFEAKNMLVHLICGDLLCDYNDAIEVDGNTYYRVTEENYTNYNNVVAIFRKYFTDNYVDALFSDTSRFIEHEGNTYFDGGTLASNINCGNDTYVKFSQNDNKAEIVISMELLDDELLPCGSTEHTFKLKFEDGGWKFDLFYLTNYSYDFNGAPQTGIDTFAYAAVAVVALAAVAAVVKKKRA